MIPAPICKRFDPYTGILFPTKKEIASFANKLINEYCKIYNKTIATIDHDEFVTKYLGIDIQYQKLSNNGSILGAAIQKNGLIQTYSYDGRLKLVKTARGEIFVDPEACGCQQRELFTIYHEIKHYFFDLDKNFMVDKIIDDESTIFGLSKPKTEYSWAEYFANYFASCILLPRRLLKKLYDKKHTEYITKYHTTLNGKRINCLKKIIREISEETGASQSAVALRLKEINLITDKTFERLDYKFGKEAALVFRLNRIQR